MKLRSLALIIGLTLLLPLTSFAQGEETVKLRSNELKVFAVHNLQRVAVGDPKVADITVLSEQEIMLVAKGEGQTTLIIWDSAGQRSYSIVVIEQNLEKVAQDIRELLSSLDVRGMQVKAEEDKVYVIGEVLTEEKLERVEDVLKPFKKHAVNLVKMKERLPLVEVDVNVLEIKTTDLKNLGMDWSNSWPITYSEPSGANIDGKLTKVWKTFRWDRTTLDARLNFLIQEDKARTLANPKLVTLSGKEASFLVGGEVPYVVVEEEGRTQVEWKEYGVNLKIEPLVNERNEIKTKIQAEVSSLDTATGVSQSGYSIPALTKREAETELFLNEGDTVFIAGLIKNEDSRNLDRLPWLSKIPILGELFKSTDFRDARTELVISITPQIIGEKASPEYLTSAMLEQEALLAAQQKFAMYSEETSPLAAYTHMVEDIITRNVAYPPQAQEESQEGIVEIDLHLLSNGQLKNAEIKKSSGFNILDTAALVAVQEQAPYPCFPSSISQSELHLAVPVVFKSYPENE